MRYKSAKKMSSAAQYDERENGGGNDAVPLDDQDLSAIALQTSNAVVKAANKVNELQKEVERVSAFAMSLSAHPNELNRLAALLAQLSSKVLALERGRRSRSDAETQTVHFSSDIGVQTTSTPTKSRTLREPYARVSLDSPPSTISTTFYS
jgi:hypothetical protein